MKDFIKWLGVNEKVAKVAVWMLIFMIFLILTNTLLESLGFSNYQITYNNLKNIHINEASNIISSLIVCFLNFYAITLLIFRVEESKYLFKYSIIYVILNWLISAILGYIAVQIYIIIFFVWFSYLYSNKNKKYISYGIIAVFINIVVEGIAYYFKANLIDIAELNRFTRSLLSLDYFIIMAVIILVKEIYLKKRGENTREMVSRKSILVGKVRQRKSNSKKNS